MKKKILLIMGVALLSCQIFAGCGAKEQNSTKNVAPKKTESSDKNSKKDKDSQVADSSEMAEPVDVSTEGLTPISADQIQEGVYTINVDSSSSMFKITNCQLTVKEGKMTAVMTMGGTGYLKLYMGTGTEAIDASDDQMIPFVENENKEHTFEIPVEALDQAVACAAFSKKKEKWYDRTLVFRSDSLPTDAIKGGLVNTVDTLGMADGSYTIEVTLEGGSGKAGIESPAKLRVENGEAFAVITWNSANYDYMKVDNVRYDAVSREEHSVFEIPVKGFDWNMAVIADTVAMSEPHEIEYTLCFDSATIAPQ